MVNNKKVWKSYLELENHISETTLFSSTFKIEEKKVPSEYWNFASKYVFGPFYYKLDMVS